MPAGWVNAVFIAGLVLAVLALLLLAHVFESRANGWRLLAQTYAHNGGFSGQRWYFGDVLFKRRGGLLYGWRYGAYGIALVMGASSEGLYMAMIPPFRLGHPSILVPWVDVNRAEIDRVHKKPSLSLNLGRESPITVTVRGRLVGQIGKYVSEARAAA